MVQLHQEGWAQVKEMTSSRLPGITFEHFKAGIQDPLIAEFEALMMSIPYETGISPRWWHQGTNVMLEKQRGNSLIDKLRAILLYEADFNQNKQEAWARDDVQSRGSQGDCKRAIW